MTIARPDILDEVRDFVGTLPDDLDVGPDTDWSGFLAWLVFEGIDEPVPLGPPDHVHYIAPGARRIFRTEGSGAGVEAEWLERRGDGVVIAAEVLVPWLGRRERYRTSPIHLIGKYDDSITLTFRFRR